MSDFAGEYAQDGPEACKIASVIPYYPFHGVPRFYDISGMTHNPEIFQLCIDIFVKRYAGMAIDAVAGLDARGFVVGPPIALALKLPFIMIRKKGKLPNAVTGEEYRKEYSGDNAAGGDELCISRTAIQAGTRVLVIDDLVATGVSLLRICHAECVFNLLLSAPPFHRALWLPPATCWPPLEPPWWSVPAWSS
jgi:adenine phosphoribosyltransferase